MCRAGPPLGLATGNVFQVSVLNRRILRELAGEEIEALDLASCLVPGGNEPCPSVGMEVEIASGRSIKWGIHSAKSDKPTVNSDRQQLTLGERTETQGFELLDIFLMTSNGPIAKFKEF